MIVAIVTSGQPSANPRAVKEAQALVRQGFNVFYIFCGLSPWADKYDNAVFEELRSVQFIRAEGNRFRKAKYLLARLRLKLLSYFTKADVCTYSLYAAELRRAAGKVKADLYIGHNLGALPAIVHAAQKNESVCAFDAEDFHRGEPKSGSPASTFSAHIEEVYFPQMRYLSVAAPLIGEEYERLFPKLPVHTVNNCFPIRYVSGQITKPDIPLRCFWFSQYIGPDRGLETIMTAFQKLATKGYKFQLVLMGNLSAEYARAIDRFEVKGVMTEIHPIGSLQEVFETAKACHIGFASEISATINRDICLTNKIFTYLLSGLCILFSDTKAQSKFLEENPQVGFLYSDVEDLIKNLQWLYEDSELLNRTRQSSLAAAKERWNWETEQQAFIKAVQSSFNQTGY